MGKRYNIYLYFGLFERKCIMKVKKYKHLSFEDRCVIEEFLNHGYNFTQISNRLGRHRTAISKEVLKHRFLRGNASPNRPCCFESLPPYVCNSCDKFHHCKKQKYSYKAHIAYNEYKQTLISERSHLNITKQQIASINEIIAPLMIKKNHSVNQVYITHPELLPFSKTTFYKYIDLGILDVRNIDLTRKVKWKVKKEYDYHKDKIDTSTKINRFYTDFKDYLEFNPNSSIVEMDTVIGTKGGNGRKYMLTLLFRQYNFMLIYLLPYKKARYVTEVFNHLKETHCDPNCSWQKGSIEKNHEFIRYILPKGTSFASLTQDDCFKIASHINSTPRLSLNNHSPYESILLFLGKDNINKFQIKK